MKAIIECPKCNKMQTYRIIKERQSQGFRDGTFNHRVPTEACLTCNFYLECLTSVATSCKRKIFTITGFAVDFIEDGFYESEKRYKHISSKMLAVLDTLNIGDTVFTEGRWVTDGKALTTLIGNRSLIRNSSITLEVLGEYLLLEAPGEYSLEDVAMRYRHQVTTRCLLSITPSGVVVTRGGKAQASIYRIKKGGGD